MANTYYPSVPPFLPYFSSSRQIFANAMRCDRLVSIIQYLSAGVGRWFQTKTTLLLSGYAYDNLIKKICIRGESKLRRYIFSNDPSRTNHFYYKNLYSILCGFLIKPSSRSHRIQPHSNVISTFFPCTTCINPPPSFISFYFVSAYLEKKRRLSAMSTRVQHCDGGRAISLLCFPSPWSTTLSLLPYG